MMGVHKTVVSRDFPCGNAEKEEELNESM